MALKEEINKLGRIGVLMGGPSSEREISLKSGKAVYESLKGASVDVVAIDILTDRRNDNILLLKNARIDCAFIALHGKYGEDGSIQEILEELRIPYTGPGVEASRLSMDKVASLEIFERHSLYVPRRVTLDKNYPIKNINFPLPWVIKPATHGSSIGLSIVDSKSELNEALRVAFSFDDRAIIEEYIAGRELTVGILDETPLPVVEIIPKKRFFDYEAKYKSGMSDYIVPADLPAGVAESVQEAALKAYKKLGCSGCSRVDFILNKDDRPYILEINTIPGFTETSLLPKAAKSAGIDFLHLCLKLVRKAYEKTEAAAGAF
jgi:D-alanine-D-alanine ligase